MEVEKSSIKIILKYVIAYVVERAVVVAPQSDHVRRVWSGGLLIVSNNRDLENIPVKKFEQLFTMGRQSADDVVSGDPGKTDLSRHYRPLVEVSYEVVDFLGDVGPTELQCGTLPAPGTQRGRGVWRPAILVHRFHCFDQVRH